MPLLSSVTCLNLDYYDVATREQFYSHLTRICVLIYPLSIMCFRRFDAPDRFKMGSQ